METRRPWYREFPPSPALRPFVRAFFKYTWAGESSWSALFAGAEPSIVVSRGRGPNIEGLWSPRSDGAYVTGPMTSFRSTQAGPGLVQFGAYLRPGCSRALLGIPGEELTDRIVALGDVLPIGEIASVEMLERALLRRLPPGTWPLSPLVSAIDAHPDGAVADLARMAGVSRQYLTRTFRQQVGVSPKLYARLARFHRVLKSAQSNWARAAMDAGYSDQSHMIADFREFTGRTPAALVRQSVFHPFAAR